MNFEFPDSQPGIHPPTAAIARILRNKNINNPLTGEPYTEAFLLGMGGGLGAGYILFPFKHLPHPMLRLGFRNQWNNTKAFLINLTKRMRFNVRFLEFKDSNAAQQSLQKTIRSGKQAIVWVDKALLPYRGLPRIMQGYINHQVAAHARDGRLWRLYIDDCSSHPIEVREKTFTSARASLRQNNFLMMIFDETQEISPRELREAIIQSIQDCALQLTQPFKAVGISSLESWAEDLTDHQSHRGWPQIFNDRKTLFPVLLRSYESIKLDGTEGFALRRMYSDFLHETASNLNNPRLNAVAGQYLQLSNHWSNLAENAIPSRIPAFDHVKNLLNKKYEAYRESKMDTFHKNQKSLLKQTARIQSDFPMDMPETEALFSHLATQIKLITELEKSAASQLMNVTRR